MISKSKQTIIAVVVAVVVLAIVAVLVIGQGHSPAAQQNSTLPYASNLTQPITAAPASPADPIISKLLLTQSQAESFFGQGGNYSAYQRTTAAQLQGVLPPEFQAYNITGVYNMTYNHDFVSTSNTFSANVLQETIFPTSNSKYFYSYVLGQDPYLNVSLLSAQGYEYLGGSSNVTVPGMTYTYASFVPLQNATVQGGNFTFEALVGMTNRSVVLVSVIELNSTGTINTTRLADAASSNLLNMTLNTT